MAVTLLVVAGCIYAVGLRADRIHAGRRVTKTSSVLAGAAIPKGRVPGIRARRLASVTVTYRGHTARYYARLAYKRGRYAHRLHRMLLTSPTVSEAINLAAATYGYGDTLWRKARCESGLNPNAKNGSEASGLFQFLPSTWATTPYARFSIFSPAASALAAGWMHAHGRGGEWSCR